MDWIRQCSTGSHVIKQLMSVKKAVPLVQIKCLLGRTSFWLRLQLLWRSPTIIGGAILISMFYIPLFCNLIPIPFLYFYTFLFFSIPLFQIDSNIFSCFHLLYLMPQRTSRLSDLEDAYRDEIQRIKQKFRQESCSIKVYLDLLEITKMECKNENKIQTSGFHFQEFL